MDSMLLKGDMTHQVWVAVARRCGLICHPLANVPRHVLIRIPTAGESTGWAEGKAEKPWRNGDFK